MRAAIFDVSIGPNNFKLKMRKAYFKWVLLVLIITIYHRAAGQNVDSLKHLLKTELADTTRANVLYRLSVSMFYSKRDSSYQLAIQLKELSESINFKIGIANALTVIAGIHNKEGRLDSAKQCYEQSIELYRDLGDTQYEATILNNLGATCMEQNLYVQALSYFQRSLELKLSNQDSTNAIITLRNIGLLHQRQKNNDLALKYYHLTLKLSKKEANFPEIANSLYYIGVVYTSKGDFSKSLEYNLESMALFDSLGRTCKAIEAILDIGEAYKELGQLDKSIEYLQLGYERSQSCHEVVNIAAALIAMGRVYKLQGKYKKAESFMIRSYKLVKKHEDKRLIEPVTANLYELFKENGEISEALFYLEENQKAKSELFNEELTREITQLELNYAFAQERDSLETQKRAELLVFSAQLEKRRVIQYTSILGLVLALILAYVIYRYYLSSKKSEVVLQEKNVTITEALNEREVLLQEIHHRVKNNLQVVSSLLNVQSKYLSDELAKKAVLEGRNRVQSIALVHEKLYQSENLSQINIKEYLEELSSTLFQSYDVSEDRVKLTSKIEPIELSIDTTVQVGLIINELISNALKYAFPGDRNGTVSVILSKKSEGHELEISDDGVGIASPDDLIKSYGYRIVRSISRGLNGTISMQHEQGTTFKLIFVA